MAKDQMNGSEILIKALQDQGVEVVFGYPGGAVLPIYDAIFQQNKLRHILVRQEGGAVHAAEGYARSTGKVGCVLVTSGPGATNAVTGLLDAMLDSVPLVCLTGQVPTHLIGNDAFQEADTTGITRPCTKHNYLVKDINDLARVVHEAFYVASSGRPGPVVIDLPKDILMALGDYMPPNKVVHKSYNPQIKGDTAIIKEAVKMLAGAKKPIIYAGGGVINSGPGASQLLAQLAHITGAPVTLTLMGLGAFPASDKQFLGMLGMHGNYEANMAMHDCDVMLCVGARFDDRITGRLDAFSPNSKKIHIDIDPSSINKSVAVDLPIIGDVGHVLEDMIKIWKTSQAKLNDKALKSWWKEIDGWRAKNCLSYRDDAKIIMPQYAIQRLYEKTKDRKDVFITTEVGQHQMWAAQYFDYREPRLWLTSGSMGTMGFGLPAAIGAQFAQPSRVVIDIDGDASIRMNIGELETATTYKLPIKVVVINNYGDGMVRQWQKLYYDSRMSGSDKSLHSKDFV
ncbi:MAG: biosynthetic-type acetolactate synthase large subunit, partial [Rhodospirillaceae bacterium]|nr:biosynthetic-type acetolactate synthase large subunit [Rhodospirillaceae bacterium]